MKKLIYIALLLAAPAMAQDQSAPSMTDASCLRLAKFAEAMAAGREMGIPEETMINALKQQPSKNPMAFASAMNTIAFVYTVHLDPAETRRAVYLKCRAGDYNRK